MYGYQNKEVALVNTTVEDGVCGTVLFSAVSVVVTSLYRRNFKGYSKYGVD